MAVEGKGVKARGLTQNYEQHRWGRHICGKEEITRKLFDLKQIKMQMGSAAPRSGSRATRADPNLRVQPVNLIFCSSARQPGYPIH